MPLSKHLKIECAMYYYSSSHKQNNINIVKGQIIWKMAQNIFMTEHSHIVVATIAFGMGIDKPDIRFVVHVNLPGSMEAYYQEIGRAGRDGNSSDTLLIYGLDDLVLRRRMIEESDSDNDYKLREHKRLDYLLSYCEAPDCRRKALLNYFDDECKVCGNCDNCNNPTKLIDGSELAQKIPSTTSLRTRSIEKRATKEREDP